MDRPSLFPLPFISLMNKKGQKTSKEKQEDKKALRGEISYELFIGYHRI